MKHRMNRTTNLNEIYDAAAIPRNLDGIVDDAYSSPLFLKDNQRKNKERSFTDNKSSSTKRVDLTKVKSISNF